MNTEFFFLQKKTQIRQWKKKTFSASGAGITACWHVEEYKFYRHVMHKTQVWVGHSPQHKSSYTVPERRKKGEVALNELAQETTFWIQHQ